MADVHGQVGPWINPKKVPVNDDEKHMIVVTVLNALESHSQKFMKKSGRRPRKTSLMDLINSGPLLDDIRSSLNTLNTSWAELAIWLGKTKYLAHDSDHSPALAYLWSLLPQNTDSMDFSLSLNDCIEGHFDENTMKEFVDDNSRALQLPLTSSTHRGPDRQRTADSRRSIPPNKSKWDRSNQAAEQNSCVDDSPQLLLQAVKEVTSMVHPQKATILDIERHLEFLGKSPLGSFDVREQCGGRNWIDIFNRPKFDIFDFDGRSQQVWIRDIREFCHIYPRFRNLLCLDKGLMTLLRRVISEEGSIGRGIEISHALLKDTGFSSKEDLFRRYPQVVSMTNQNRLSVDEFYLHTIGNNIEQRDKVK